MAWLCYFVLSLQCLLFIGFAQASGEENHAAVVKHTQAISGTMNDWRLNENHWQHKTYQSVTFIFLGDGTQELLTRTVHAIRAVTDCTWSLIILYSVFDQNELSSQFETRPPFHLSSIRMDSRITYLPTMNAVQSMQLILPRIETVWVSLLEIGDRPLPKFFKILRSEIIAFPGTSSVIFQTPETSPSEIHLTRSGSRYALKHSLLANYQFLSGSLTDYVSTVIHCSGSSLLSGEIPFYSPPFSLPKEQKRQNSTLVDLKVSSPQICQATEQSVSLSVPGPVLDDAKLLLSRFIFPEAQNLFFAENVRGLREALLRAHKLGCIAPTLQVSHSILSLS
jgi:hypothetical protein